MKIIKEALYIVSFGSSDFLQNYYINPVLKITYSPDRYSDILIGSFQDLIKVRKEYYLPIPLFKKKT